MKNATLTTDPGTDAARSATLTTDPAVAAVGQATVSVHGLLGQLEPHFAVLTPEQRDHLTIVPNTFTKAASAMLDALSTKPAIAAACEGFDADAVQAQLDAAAQLVQLANQVDQLKALVDDGLRTSLTGAFTSVLPVYNTAKSASRYDTTLRPIVAPLEEMFAERSRSRVSKGKAPKPEAPEAEAPETEEK